MDTITATGRRKNAIARVFLRKGKGSITINNKNFMEYFTVPHHQLTVEEPTKHLDVTKEFDITVNVTGGGVRGQSEAVRLGICRALIEYNPEYKPALKAQKWLTRDPRVVERKKPGLRKARKATQFSKR